MATVENTIAACRETPTSRLVALAAALARRALAGRRERETFEAALSDHLRRDIGLR